MAFRVSHEQLIAIQKETKFVRNICILAHVDHGKTTLSDMLITSNGIISHKLAGKVRYLDNTEEEQQRGITMKSSAISLLYHAPPPGAEEGEGGPPDSSLPPSPLSQPYLINLIDSPGHVDFSSDVSSAVRLCDGALIIIDVLEGVCAQTHAVLRQAWAESVRPCLILNKIDRLILELQLSPAEAYEHLQRIVEQVNATVLSMLSAEVMAAAEKDHQDQGNSKRRSSVSRKSDREKEEGDTAVFTDWQLEFDDEREAALVFSPEKGNVLFASAIDGWAFGVGYFARVFSKKLDYPMKKLRLALWGDYYWDAKEKRVTKKPPKSTSLPLFVQLALEPIWAVYKAVIMEPDKERVTQILKSLRILKHIPPRELESPDRKIALCSIFRKWLPLSSAVLRMVTRVLPSPSEAQKVRIDRIWPPSLLEKMTKSRRGSESEKEEREKVQKELQEIEQTREAVATCDTSSSAPVIVYVSKMIAVEKRLLSDFLELVEEERESRGELSEGQDGEDGERRERNGKSEEVFVAFARVFSGTLSRNQVLHVLGPKYLPQSGSSLSSISLSRHVTTVSSPLRLYMLMGRELFSLASVPAGNIVGILGLGEHVLKTATVSSSLLCPSFSRMPFQARPIVRVAVEPVNLKDLPLLEAGLQLLYKADPTVEVRIQETGEHVIIALGELHLERCLKDLRERFAKVPLHCSPPIVSFRETITGGNTPANSFFHAALEKKILGDLSTSSSSSLMPSSVASSSSLSSASARVVRIPTPNRKIFLSIRAHPLPTEVAFFLDENAATIRSLLKREEAGGKEEEDEETSEHASRSKDVSEEERGGKGGETLEDFKERLVSLLQESGDEIWASVIEEHGIWSFGPRRVGPNLLVSRVPGFAPHCVIEPRTPKETEQDGGELGGKSELFRSIEGSVVTGFQLASSSGPLCEEPVWGVAFFLEEIETEAEEQDGDEGEKVSGPDPFGPLSGQVISTMRGGCRLAFLRNPVRLVEAMYRCTLQCDTEQLGNLYGVIARRRGKVIKDDLQEGTTIFSITANIPVVESFGFAEELLKKTSGSVSSPQLVFSHWEVMDIDPFFQPTTQEEREEHGEKIYESNIAKKYIEATRKRKGLSVEEKIVVHAEKQRTLTRMK